MIGPGRKSVARGTPAWHDVSIVVARARAPSEAGMAVQYAAPPPVLHLQLHEEINVYREELLP